MTAGIRVSVTQPSVLDSMELTGCHLVFFDSFNIDSPVIFAGALTIFAGALSRGPHPGDGVDYDTVTADAYC